MLASALATSTPNSTRRVSFSGPASWDARPVSPPILPPFVLVLVRAVAKALWRVGDS